MTGDDPTPTVARDLAEALAKLARMEARCEGRIRQLTDSEDARRHRPNYPKAYALKEAEVRERLMIVQHLRSVLERHECANNTAWCLRCEDEWPCPDARSALETVEGMAE